MAQCNFCPRQCRVDRDTDAGFCGMKSKPVVARAALHFWEEPCISGGNGSGAVFFSGCNLRCVFCQNYDISTCGSGKEISSGRLREIYQDLIAQKADNINLVTPMHFSDAVLDSLTPPPGVPVIINTNGYESVDNLRRFEGKADIYLPDMKYSDDQAAERYSHAPDYFEKSCNAIKEMYRQTGKYQLDESTGLLKSGVIIRHLVLPGMLENTRGVIDFVAKNFAPGEVLFSLMRQYIPCGKAEDYPEINRKTSDEEYETAVEYLFQSGIEDGFLQEKESAGSEFIPAFDGTGL